MVKDIAIGFVTGRKHFQNVLKTYINNWLEHGLIESPEVRLHLFIAYDLAYQKTEIADYKNIDPQLAKIIASITFIGERTVSKEIAWLTENGTATPKELALIFGDGYAKKRNAVLYFALKQKMNKLIFLDDDEYPMAVFKDPKNCIMWMGQSIVGTHLLHNDAADITHGHHCGYISPIPSITFNSQLSEKQFRLFIETISNDIISWENVKQNILVNKGVTYANAALVNAQTVSEVPAHNGMKFISGANICFNLDRIGTQLPPFFNPPGARGEDTFMSTCLADLKVLKVPCYAFHDGFSNNNSLLQGVLPLAFLPADTTDPAVISRFVKACIGWIRYKPLLLYVTNPALYDQAIKEMKANLARTLDPLCAYFGTEKFRELEKELHHYDKNVMKHFRAFEHTKAAWKKVIENH